jgi:hypothetical protein
VKEFSVKEIKTKKKNCVKELHNISYGLTEHS